MASLPIDISRPAGEYRTYDQPVVLSKQRYRLITAPTESGRSGSWWLTLMTSTGITLITNVRMVASPDLIAFARTTIDSLPPGRLQLVCLRDPGPDDLAVPGVVALTYETDEEA